MKRIIIDFEFTGVDIHNVELLEFCALFMKGDEVVDRVISKIKFERKYTDVNETTRNGLIFNKILSQKDLDKHNASAKHEKEVLESFLKKAEKFGKLPLTGWNNGYADVNLLLKVMDRYNYVFTDYFDYHVRDVMAMMMPIYDHLLKDKCKFHLDTVHMHLFGTIKKEDFHKAEVDCIAIADVDNWIQKKIKTLK